VLGVQLVCLHEGGTVDPFQSQKDEALTSCTDAVRKTVVPLLQADTTPAEGCGCLLARQSLSRDPACVFVSAFFPLLRLYDWLLRSLWGNKGDLSRSGGAVSSSHLDSHMGSDEHILRNDAPDAVALLLGSLLSNIPRTKCFLLRTFCAWNRRASHRKCDCCYHS
jgi:hypothetical protein